MGFLFDFKGFLSLGVVHILLCRVLGLELDTSSDLRWYSCVGPCTGGSFGLVLINFIGRGLGTFRKGLVLWSISSWLSNSVVLDELGLVNRLEAGIFRKVKVTDRGTGGPNSAECLRIQSFNLEFSKGDWRIIPKPVIQKEESMNNFKRVRKVLSCLNKSLAIKLQS
ncbi:hypothetical protein C2G38_2047335 [Gigaspora rosea]|uniref:Uncharacterized protein n=1 Tax=Gigaspora rosea TaxID=44941 RepID=A0A397U668_9GLOM|nr:hypothetical protein C2G38_2047335 [Gigaspora rosea]